MNNFELVKSLRNKGRFRFFLFLILNFFIVAFLSTLKFDPSKSTLIGITFEFDLIRTLIILLVVSILQILLIYLSTFALLNQSELIQIFPAKDNQSQFATEELKRLRKYYDIEGIIDLVQNLAKKIKVDVDRVFITSTPIPNAFTFRLPFIGSIVNINTNIMDFLSTDEIEAVIAHELGHIKEKDSIQKIISSTPSTFIHLSFSYFYLLFIIAIMNSIFFQFSFLQAGIRLVIFVGFFIVTNVISYYSKVLITSSERISEKICDLYAAEIVSPIITINMLIHLGQRVETINILMNEFKRMEKKQRTIITNEDMKNLMHLVGEFPLYEIDESKARVYGPFLYILNQLNILRETYQVPLNREEIQQLAQEASVHHIEQGSNEELDKITQDWREFDKNKDQILSKDELTPFIEQLRNENRTFLFENEVYVDHLVQEHPDFRKRVLNVYKHYMEN